MLYKNILIVHKNEEFHKIPNLEAVTIIDEGKPKISTL